MLVLKVSIKLGQADNNDMYSHCTARQFGPGSMVLVSIEVLKILHIKKQIDFKLSVMMGPVVSYAISLQ